jgi:energy-coupling factor transporter ATP-binding protein EcfA2
MKNSTNTNLLVLDEIFDGSLDGQGTDDFFKIIKSMPKENIFIISHKGDILFDKFTNIIRFDKEHNFTIVGMDELGKSKPATLFFLSKNGFIGNNIKFIKSDEISDMWTKCDYWITDSEKIITECPKEKNVIKFNTPYNQYFTNQKEITKLTQINEPCLKFLENNTILISTESQKNVK